MPQPRKTAHLSDSVLRQLNAYALAASAAGVSLLAIAPPSQARIIYTPAHKHIGPNTLVKLDLDHNGAADFELKDIHKTSTLCTCAYGLLSVLPAQQRNQIWGHADGTVFASALLSGVRVGPKGQFLYGKGRMASIATSGGGKRDGLGTCTGPWAYVNHRYLGLKFTIKGKTHFGWARLNVSCSSQSWTVTGTLTGYAYETVANRPILTGRKRGPDEIERLAEPDGSDAPATVVTQPATLGRLARGADGLAAGRGQ